MQLPLSSLNKSKIGTCPHGLPQGACPICSGMGGGGGAKREIKSKPDEMTWDECFAIGQMLKAQKLAQQQRQQGIEQQLSVPLNFGARLANVSQNIALFSQKVANFAQKAQNLPNIISKPVVFILNKIALPILNLIKDLPLVINKAINFIREKLADISDKLNAMFGELKNSTEKKVSDFLKDFKKRIKSIFDLPDLSKLDDEDKKIEEDKRIFEFKKYLNKNVMLNLIQHLKRKNETLKQVQGDVINNKKANVKYEN